ncbi:OLC1v1014154C1 [Oldenlandia corymbosa var. corymbosa]|uniref:OLC1v1014154C1 n=1 Tax=Oldenlandia corymbosa var. corymbosa TaxID=529605 RepID=A0AAV1E069_OLDCO|nr:OLC1v1014154C1 [Oldenlandia corymbosa var. corymbosa]
MPRKGNYKIDYDDDDEDDYGAYDEIPLTGYHSLIFVWRTEYVDKLSYICSVTLLVLNPLEHVTKDKLEAIKTGVWRCPICTFDNDDYMSACDICGVLRNPLVKGSSKSNSSPVGGICKDSGASIMAKSLFASPPHRRPKKAVFFEEKNDASFSGQPGKVHGDFHVFLRAFNSEKNYKINIAPFKFDIPSPDDVVSNGIRTSKLGFKDVFTKEEDNTVEVERELPIEGPDIVTGSTSKDRSTDTKGHSFPSDKEVKTESISSGMGKMSVSSKSGIAENISGVRNLSITPFKPEKWMLPDEVEDKMQQLSLAIVGHVDSGKSTLSGRLLHLLGRISQKQFHKNEKDSKQQGKGSFAYAWALDESAEERERGITMTVGVQYFDSKKYHIVLLDSPGHRDFVPNMITGATQADAAILVVDASMGAFEAGMDKNGGQTREHAQLIRSFGADQIIVAVNKMDSVEYSRERFEIIKQKLGTFLHSCGFKESSLLWIPVSAMENQNLVNGPSDVRLSWFQGPCLLDAIDSLQPPKRDYEKPLLLPICDVLRSQPQGQLAVGGKVETGALRSGSKVLVMPSRVVATVRSLERDSHACNVARAGDNVNVSLLGVDANQVSAGGVLCHPDFPVAVSKHFELKIRVLEITMPILIGSQMELHVHHAKEAARVVKILSLLDPKTGQVSKRTPRCLLANQNAAIEVVLEEEVCVEEYTKCRALGRVSLRASGRTIAVGVVTKIFVGSEA